MKSYRRRSQLSLYPKQFARSAFSVFALCVLCAFVENTPAQEFKQMHPGVEYAQVVHKIAEDPVKINLLRLDLTKVRLDVHHAFDRAIGLETTSSIAKRKGGVAAINAGFFRLDKSPFAGEAAGLLVIDHNVLSESHQSRAVLMIGNFASSTLVGFDSPDVWVLLRAGKRIINLDGLNRERKDDELIMYTPEYSELTPKSSMGSEYVIKGKRLKAVVVGTGNTKIPKGGFVLSASEKWKGLGSNLLTVGQKLKVEEWYSLENPQKSFAAEDITNGVAHLVKEGRIDITWEQEKASKAFAETRHPRTAAAKLKDGKFLMVTVDGRQPGVSVGMSLQELAEYLLSLGAVDAMNLDGGGSTTMYLDGRVVNTPSDKEGERKIGDAIVVTLRK